MTALHLLGCLVLVFAAIAAMLALASLLVLDRHAGFMSMGIFGGVALLLTGGGVYLLYEARD